MIAPEVLQQLGLFANLSRDLIGVLAKHLRPLGVEAGELLVTEGVTTRGPLFIVTDGDLEVSRQDASGASRTLAFLEPPTVVGEMEFLADVVSSASVRATSDVTGALLPRDRFEALFEAGEPAVFHLALAIGRLVSQRLADTNVLLSKALSHQPERLAKVQKVQATPGALSSIDDELDELLR